MQRNTNASQQQQLRHVRIVAKYTNFFMYVDVSFLEMWRSLIWQKKLVRIEI
jgi:hypothetical protein